MFRHGAKTEVFAPWLSDKNFCCGNCPSGPDKIRLSISGWKFTSLLSGFGVVALLSPPER
jgi:hypothetical protein